MGNNYIAILQLQVLCYIFVSLVKKSQSLKYQLQTTMVERLESAAPLINPPLLFTSTKYPNTSSVITSPGISNGIPGGYGHTNSPLISPTLSPKLTFFLLAKMPLEDTPIPHLFSQHFPQNASSDFSLYSN